MQHCSKLFNLRLQTWPLGASLVEKLWGSLEAPRRTTGFIEKSGLIMWRQTRKKTKHDIQSTLAVGEFLVGQPVHNLIYRYILPFIIPKFSIEVDNKHLCLNKEYDQIWIHKTSFVFNLFKWCKKKQLLSLFYLKLLIKETNNCSLSEL